MTNPSKPKGQTEKETGEIKLEPKIKEEKDLSSGSPSSGSSSVVISRSLASSRLSPSYSAGSPPPSSSSGPMLPARPATSKKKLIPPPVHRLKEASIPSSSLQQSPRARHKTERCKFFAGALIIGTVSIMER